MEITIDKSFDLIKSDVMMLNYFTDKMDTTLFDHNFRHRLKMVREHLLDIEQLLIELMEEKE